MSDSELNVKTVTQPPPVQSPDSRHQILDFPTQTAVQTEPTALRDANELHSAIPQIPGYEIIAPIGRGGMGEVFRAKDLALNREVAVKILQEKYLPHSPMAVRFVEEAQITGQLQHPGVPAVYQVSHLANGRPFLAMKLIKGDTLDALIKSNTPLNALAVFESIAQTVGYAHAHNVIHRDLKPANIMVGAFGEVQVMDWGLAKVLGIQSLHEWKLESTAESNRTEIKPMRDSEGSLTMAGSVMGTPAYMPPEQAAGELEKIDQRSDVFGLGAILCVILTGKPPFDGTSYESVKLSAIRGKMDSAFARLDACRGDSEVIALCKNCLQFESQHRPANGNEVALAVAELRKASESRAQRAELEKAKAEVTAAEAIKRRVADKRAKIALGLISIFAIIGFIRSELAKNRAEKAETNALIAVEKEILAKREAEARDQESRAILQFVDQKIFGAARPKDQDGGLGRDVLMRDAIRTALPSIGQSFRTQPLVEAKLREMIGRTALYFGESKLAAEQFEIAKTICLAEHGRNHLETFSIINNLAIAMTMLGKSAQALAMIDDILPVMREKLGENHLKLIDMLNAKANCLTALRRNEEALTLREQILEQRKITQGPNHQDTLKSMNNLAGNYAELGRPLDSLKLHEETLALRKATLSLNHPDILRSQFNRARTLATLDRHQESLDAYTELLPLRQERLGPDHPDTLKTLSGIATELMKLKRSDEALPVIDETLKLAAAAQANGKRPDPQLFTAMLDFRFDHFEAKKNVAGCRETAERWENLNRTDEESYYESACMRAKLANLLKENPAESRLEADRAMDRLKQAVKAGWKDRAHIEEDQDLNILRGREDFKALVNALPKQPK